MTDEHEQSEAFHDDELKSAVVRLHGSHRVDPALRERVLRELVRAGAIEERESDSAKRFPRLAQAAPESPANRRPLFRSPRLLAMAASLLILLGAGAMYWRHVRHEAEERREYLEANLALLETMVDVHRHGCEPESALAITAKPGDSPAVAAQLQERLGRWIPTISPQGWNVSSASVCKVGKLRGAVWRLTRSDGGGGSKNMTILSLPASAFKVDEEYEDYSFVVEGFAIAGFVKDGGVHCLVVDPPLTEGDAVTLRDLLRGG